MLHIENKAILAEANKQEQASSQSV